MKNPGTVSVSDWNGDNGDRWVAHQARLDRMLAGFGDAAIAATAPWLAPGVDARILDIGSGAGTSSLALADRIGPAGAVLGVDISAALVDCARARVPAGAPIRFDLADAATAPLDRAGFDLIFSRFGVMFFDDPVAAFAHLRAALKPGGRLVFVCWRGAAENDWVRLPMGAIRDLIPPAPAPDPEAPGPFSFGDHQRVERILAAAGFDDRVVTAFDAQIRFGEGASASAAVDDALNLAFEVGPLARALAGQPDALRQRAMDAVRRAFADRVIDTSVMIDGAAWIVTARNPV